MEPDIYKIEQYVSGQMTADEQAAFEAAMAADPALAEEVDAYRLAEEVVDLAVEESLREQLREWHTADAPGNQQDSAKVVSLVARRSWRRILAIAAGVLILLFVGSYWYADRQYSSDALALSYFSADDPLSTVRAGGNAHPLAGAIDALRSEDFEQAEAALQAVPPSDENYADARFFLGLNYYLQDRPAQAIDIWQPLENDPNPLLAEKASWYLILAHLRTDEVDKADLLRQLQDITADPDHAYHRQASELAASYQSFWYKLAN